MLLETPPEPLLNRGSGTSVGGFCSQTIQHVIYFIQDPGTLFRYRLCSFDGFARMDGIHSLKDAAGLFKHHREESHALGDVVDFGTGISDFAADSIQDKREPEASTCDAHNGRDGAYGRKISRRFQARSMRQRE